MPGDGCTLTGAAIAVSQYESRTWGNRKLRVANTIVVNIADLKVSNDPNVELITYSLGSCIGIAAWDPLTRVGGLLHLLLGNSTLCPSKAIRKPAMFADTGIPLLFRTIYDLGGVKQRLIVKIAGGAAMFETSAQFDIGRLNLIAVRKVFQQNGIQVESEHTGDRISRTMRLHIGTGRVCIANQKQKQLVI